MKFEDSVDFVREGKIPGIFGNSEVGKTSSCPSQS